MQVRATAAVETHQLRQQILRPHQMIDEMAWPGDDDPRAIHLVAGDDDEDVGVVSFIPLPRAGSTASKGFRLRGMGVVEPRRSDGIGTALIAEGVARVRAEGGDEIWCHARIGAVDFYERVGFVAEGDYWDEPIIGPHIVMHRSM